MGVGWKGGGVGREAGGERPKRVTENVPSLPSDGGPRRPMLHQPTLPRTSRSQAPGPVSGVRGRGALCPGRPALPPTPEEAGAAGEEGSAPSSLRKVKGRRYQLSPSTKRGWGE